MTEITHAASPDQVEVTGPAAVSVDPLAVVTFADLVGRIRGKRSRASSVESAEAWQALLDVVEDKERSALPSGFDAVTGRRWFLVELRVSGFQGIGADGPLVLSLDPTPGVTVVHGPNGSGKSSIADAVDAVLHARPSGSNPVVTGTGGKAPLWNRVYCGRDAPEATLALTLSDGAERLHLSAVLDRDGLMVAWRADIDTGGERREVQLDGSWGSALAGHQPVFGYAGLERRVQTSRDLKEYLDLLIALGGCFDVLAAEVDRRSAAATDALKAFHAALRLAQQDVARADSAHVGEEALPELVWPDVADDPDTWLHGQQLTETGRALPEIGAGHGTALTDVGIQVVDALDDLHEARTGWLDELSDGLQRLHRDAAHLAGSHRVCPVCDTRDVDWRSRLQASVEGFERFAELSAAVAAALARLRRTTRDAVDPVFVVAAALPPSDPSEAVVHGRRLVDDFVAATDREGIRSTTAVDAAARALAEWLRSPDCAALVRHVTEVSDRRRRRLRERRAAVSGFVDVWRTRRAEAAKAQLWTRSRRHLSELSTDLRGERSAELGERAGRRIADLLDDAGITLTAIDLTKTKADLRLQDPGGAALHLGMLSSGQRNAVLLAPLLALTTGGPFGFVVLDDPVHAFDELRVDRLAAVIEEIAVTRRVVVLTHDERFREHLVALPSGAEVHSITRDPMTGVVSLTAGRPMWSVLLDDARAAVELDGPATLAAGTVEIVRGLCRQALDQVLRTFVVRLATRAGADPKVVVRQVDAAATTRDRLMAARRVARGLTGDAGPVNAANRFVVGHLEDWNRAAHGNPARRQVTPAEITAEIAAVRRAAERLDRQEFP
jgi:energy-coupling factor transporter ATP-binding protein EcfA2